MIYQYTVVFNIYYEIQPFLLIPFVSLFKKEEIYEKTPSGFDDVYFIF